MTKQKLPIAKEGLPLIFRFFAAAALLLLFPYLFLNLLGLVLLVCSLFCIYFFRDPERKILAEPFLILSPGDGRILEVTEEENSILKEKTKVVKIFLSIFDVHVQRSPISGTVCSIEYKKGNFFDARDFRAAKENEQNSILIENDTCKTVVTQIAGKIARRIHCWVRQGQEVAAGERLGIIRFGSQVDIFLPQEVEICVSKGEKVFGGISIIAIRRQK